MSTRRERKRFDVLLSRTFLSLIGASFVAVGWFMLNTGHESGNLQILLGWIFSLVGVTIILSGLLLGGPTVVKFAENTGNHEALIVYYLLAAGLAWSISRVTKKT